MCACRAHRQTDRHQKNAVLCDAAAEAVAREVEPGLFHRHSEETVWALGN